MAGPPIVAVDVTAAPWTAGWAERAAEQCAQWHPLVAALLDTPGFTVPSNLTLRLVPTIGGGRRRVGTPGSTSGSVITVGADWIALHPADTGLVLHELVHVIQRYPSGEPWWVTEGIADWVRYQRFETRDPRRTPDLREARHTDGYAATGAFLEWIEHDLGIGIVRLLNNAMRRRAWSESVFVDAAGATADELWQRFAKVRHC